jgi:hypothetical protein
VRANNGAEAQEVDPSCHDGIGAKDALIAWPFSRNGVSRDLRLKPSFSMNTRAELSE